MTWLPVSDWEGTFVWFPRFDHNGTLLWGKCQRRKIKKNAGKPNETVCWQYHRFNNNEILGGDPKQETETLTNLLQQAKDKTDNDEKLVEAVQAAFIEAIDCARRAAKDFDKHAKSHDQNNAPTLALIATSQAFGAGSVATNLELIFARKWPEKRNYLVTRDLEKAEQALVEGINHMAEVRGIHVKR